MPSELIFVTGASGFLGSHVVQQLLEEGYRVRATARGAKADQLKSSYASYGDRFESISISDVSCAQFSEALVGVDAIIHVASPLPGRLDPASLLAAAVDGTLNILVQGEKAGVKRIVVTSSIASAMIPGGSLTDQDWNPITKEIALNCGNEVITYCASKTFAEAALWEWADKHPHVDVTTLNPTLFYGPFTPHFPLPTPDLGGISTNFVVYNLLFPDGTFPSDTRYIDVRDAARAHLRALHSAPASQVGRKRILLSSPHGQSLKKRVELIAERRPALKERLITATPQVREDTPDVLPIDFARVEEVLGMRMEHFHSIEETILDTVDALIEVEAQWRSAGHPIVTPPPAF
ncbi:hypothetical protein DFH08DRAFT_927331 [Mycena albidolilacea]|uniref:NAD-dependent epimerase/dehydratase domain-containing protein n=1 Tax=Mycena albidolilacea TaxID=1033008 RepID=A0AAD6Z5W4_9AGAR|nr:hypothetical protein DFH08DRAFT_927331 [Mycena albidolilacea]